MPNHRPNRPSLSIKSACEYLGISRSLIYRLIKSRDLASYKISRRTFIHPDELDRFINSKQPHKTPARMSDTIVLLTREHMPIAEFTDLEAARTALRDLNGDGYLAISLLELEPTTTPRSV